MTEKTNAPIKSEKHRPAEREETRNSDWFVRPAVDIYEDAEGLTVVADLPGIDAGGLTINVEDGILTLEAKPGRKEENGFPSREFRQVGFFRQFQLPDEVDQEKIAAALKNGVLHLELPRAERAKPRRIEVELA